MERKRTEKRKRDRVCEKRHRSPAYANHGGQNRPWTLSFYTQASPRDHLKFEDKMGRGGEAARKHEEDFTPEEPPSSLSRPTVSGEQRQGAPSSLHPGGELRGPKLDQPAAGPQASSGSGQRCPQ